MLTKEGTIEQDIVIKRVKFIQSSVEVRALFSFAAPSEVLHALKVYSSSYNGSNFWYLKGNADTSAKTDILNMYVKFFHTFRSSASQEEQVLSRYLAIDLKWLGRIKGLSRT